ncbi:MAG: hypothetical protein M3R38_20555 [Actinomycetota bacterium]|nr:hypothetical protein [Actinomycetota bacterium]
MATSVERIPAEAGSRKTERPPRQHVVTPEERKQRTLLAKAFLDRMGRDDDLDAHHSCLERLGG